MPLKILIIDDDKNVRDVLHMKLGDLYPDATVSQAADGLAGISAIREEAEAGEVYDVVFTDMQMPGMTGLDVITMARRENMISGIVLMSGIMDNELRNTALRSGADLALEKPSLIPKMVEAAVITAKKAKDRRAGG